MILNMPLLLINYSTFKLLNDGLTSTDINECENPNNCNHLGQLCINEPGKFTCVCIKGYHLVQSAGVCVFSFSFFFFAELAMSVLILERMVLV